MSVYDLHTILQLWPNKKTSCWFESSISILMHISTFTWVYSLWSHPCCHEVGSSFFLLFFWWSKMRQNVFSENCFSRVWWSGFELLYWNGCVGTHNIVLQFDVLCQFNWFRDTHTQSFIKFNIIFLCNCLHSDDDTCVVVYRLFLFAFWLLHTFSKLFLFQATQLSVCIQSCGTEFLIYGMIFEYYIRVGTWVRPVRWNLCYVWSRLRWSRAAIGTSFPFVNLSWWSSIWRTHMLWKIGGGIVIKPTE